MSSSKPKSDAGDEIRRLLQESEKDFELGAASLELSRRKRQRAFELLMSLPVKPAAPAITGEGAEKATVH